MCWSRLWSGHKVRLYSQLRHRVPYTMIFFGLRLCYISTFPLRYILHILYVQYIATSQCYMSYLPCMTSTYTFLIPHGSHHILMRSIYAFNRLKSSKSTLPPPPPFSVDNFSQSINIQIFAFWWKYIRTRSRPNHQLAIIHAKQFSATFPYVHYRVQLF